MTAVSYTHLEIFGRFNELVHVLEKFLRANTGIDLSGGNIGMSQHSADGFYRHTQNERLSFANEYQ